MIFNLFYKFSPLFVKIRQNLSHKGMIFNIRMAYNKPMLYFR